MPDTTTVCLHMHKKNMMLISWLRIIKFTWNLVCFSLKINRERKEINFAIAD